MKIFSFFEDKRGKVLAKKVKKLINIEKLTKEQNKNKKEWKIQRY